MEFEFEFECYPHSRADLLVDAASIWSRCRCLHFGCLFRRSRRPFVFESKEGTLERFNIVSKGQRRKKNEERKKDEYLYPVAFPEALYVEIVVAHRWEFEDVEGEGI